MKIKEALQIINGTESPKGFRVSFEKAVLGALYSDHFPERGEKLIETEEEAWRLAAIFAEKSRGKYVNILVVDETWSPVKGYEKKVIKNRLMNEIKETLPPTDAHCLYCRGAMEGEEERRNMEATTCRVNSKGVVGDNLEDLENQIDVLRGEIGNLVGRLNWTKALFLPILMPETPTPQPETNQRDAVEPVLSDITTQIQRMYRKTGESIGLLRKTMERLDI